MAKRPSQPPLPMIQSAWPAPPWVKSFTTVRTPGGSKDNYKGLNVAAHVGDDIQDVGENRRLLESNLPQSPRWLEQVHGCNVVSCESEGNQADGLFTQRAGQPLGIMSADCLPILLTNRKGTWIGALHGGWRGLVSGIVDNGVRAFPGDPNELLAWIGPGIGAPSYEVDLKVRDAVLDGTPTGAEILESFFLPGRDEDHWQMDLAGLAKILLHSAGVPAVYGQTWDTYGLSELFFSHRRQAPTGRMATLIWLEK